jgi:CRP/FNR family cyclic AMP-dependent transcriptional regulator
MGLNFIGDKKSVTQQVPAKGPYLEGVNELELLSAMDIFRDLPKEKIEALINKFPMRTARKGSLIYGAEGPEGLFLLKSGKAELFRLSPEGKKLILAIVERGTFLGEMYLIGQNLEGTYAVAIEDSVICPLSRQDLEWLILEYPMVGLRIIGVLAQWLQETRNALQEMIFNDVTGRVAGLLLNLSDEHTNVVKGYSHQDLAAMVGCLRESFTTALDRFKRTNAVVTGRKRIEITDRAQLERVVRQKSGAPAMTETPRLRQANGLNPEYKRRKSLAATISRRVM